jgi:hypothetical protein
MPQFYFHVAQRGDLFEDRDGWHYLDVDSATAYGWRLALDLRGAGNFAAATVLVVDEFGREVARLPVGNAFGFSRDRQAADPASETHRGDPDRARADAPRSGE